jgi:hypothetical protein
MALYGRTKVADGQRLVIRTHSFRPSIDASLWDAERNRKFTRLSLLGELGVHGYQQQQALNLDQDLAATIGGLLQRDDRLWERIEFEHCTSHIDIVVAIPLARNTVLCFSFSEVRFELPTMFALSTGLKFNASLVEICFRRCTFDDMGVTALAEGFRYNRTIKSMVLDQCNMPDDHLNVLVSALNESGCMQRLSLEGNRCRNFGMAALSSLLERKCLVNLNLHNQHLEEDEVLDIAVLAASLYPDKSLLKFLDLSRNSLGDNEISHLVDALIGNCTLETLHLDHNNISDAGATKLGEALPFLTGLKTLALPSNPFGGAGALALLLGMQENLVVEAIIVPTETPNDIQRKIRWYGNLNKGGRRLFSTPRRVSLALFPLAMQRVNEMRLTHNWNPSITPAEVFFGLLRYGPILFEPKISDL